MAVAAQVVMEVHDLPRAVEAATAAGAAAGAGAGADAAVAPADVATEGAAARGQLQRVQAVLAAAGFSHVVCEQEAGLEGTSIYNLYARRG